MRTGEPPREPLEDLSPRQVHLIRTTYQLIGERGLRQVSLRQVAEAAGVSKALIFYHFKTKENLVLATMRWVLRRAGERIRGAVERAETPAGKVVAMIDEIFSDPEANRRFYVAYLDLVDHAIRLDDFSKLSATFRSIVDSLYAEVVALGVAQGAFLVHDVEEAASTLRAIMDGLFLQWIQDPDRERAHPRYREAAKRAVLAYLHASPAGTGAAAYG